MNINFSAPINFTGMGIVGINLFKELVSSGHNVSLFPLPYTQQVEAHQSNHEIIKMAVDNQANYNKDAPSVRHWHPFDLAQHVGKGPHVGSTVFELDRFTKRELNHLHNQDALCVPTTWGKCILEEQTTLPILVLPHGVDRTIFHENVEPAPIAVGKHNETVFVNVGKNEIRKGHDVLIEAFNKAFEPSDNVRLIVSFYNWFNTKEENDAWIGLYKDSKMGDKVDIVDGRLATQQDVAAFMACADVGVFPSRSEGFGLESLECLSLGKHLIISNCCGHTEYCSDRNSLLIEPGPMEDAYDGKFFFNQGKWFSMGAEQIDQMVSHMRKAHVMKQHGELLPNKPGIETAKQFSWRSATDKLVQFLERV